MVAILRPQRWMQQPQLPVSLNWAHPLVAAIQPVYVYLPSAGFFYNAVTRSNQGSFQNSPTRINTPVGVGLNSPTYLTGMSTGTAGHFIKTGFYPDSTCRFLSILTCMTDTVANGTTPGYTHGGTHDGTRRFYVSTYSDFGVFQRIAGWGGGYIAVTGTLLPVGTMSHMTLVRPLTGDAPLYENGRALHAITNPTWTGGASSRQLYLGKRTANTATENGSCSAGTGNAVVLAVVGRGAPDSSTVREFVRCPWQIFNPLVS